MRRSRLSYKRLGYSLFTFAFLALLLWPILYAVWISFTPKEFLEPPLGEWSLRWYRRFWASPQWTAGLWNSLKVAGMTVLGSVLCGAGMALAVTRYHFRGKKLLSGAVLLPLFVPAVVLGMGLLPFVRALGLWGSRLSLAAAHCLWSLPVVFLVAKSALEELDPDLEKAARGLGAGPLATFWRVTLPLISPSVIVGALMAFILSLNEFIMALFLGTPSIETLPKVIWPNLRYTLSPLVAAASGVMMLFTFLGLVLVLWLLRLDRFVRRLF